MGYACKLSDSNYNYLVLEHGSITSPTTAGGKTATLTITLSKDYTNYNGSVYFGIYNTSFSGSFTIYLSSWLLFKSNPPKTNSVHASNLTSSSVSGRVTLYWAVVKNDFPIFYLRQHL